MCLQVWIHWGDYNVPMHEHLSNHTSILIHFHTHTGREAGRALPKPRSRVRSRDCLLHKQAPPKIQDGIAPPLRQAVPLPTVAGVVPHPRAGDLPQRHQAAKPAGQPREPTAEALRFRECKGVGEGGAQCELYL